MDEERYQSSGTMLNGFIGRAKEAKTFYTKQVKDLYKKETGLDPDTGVDVGGMVQVSAHFLEWISAIANDAERLENIVKDLEYQIATATVHFER